LKRIAQFEKVSEPQFEMDMGAVRAAGLHHELPDSADCYDNIYLPKRATVGSAGYDFYAPFEISLEAGQEMTIPTGIRVRIEDGWVLHLYPRSGLGVKFRFQLNNTVGIIDADYYHANNEGHIIAKMINDSRDGKTVSIPVGTGFMQGIFLPFGITVDDAAEGLREGGFGSTSAEHQRQC